MLHCAILQGLWHSQSVLAPLKASVNTAGWTYQLCLCSPCYSALSFSLSIAVAIPEAFSLSFTVAIPGAKPSQVNMCTFRCLTQPAKACPWHATKHLQQPPF